MSTSRKVKKAGNRPSSKNTLKSITISDKVWKIALAIIFGIGLLIRLLHIGAVHQSDLKNLHAWQEFDSQFFDDWALKIGEGDLLTNQSLHPYHEWHRGIASFAIKDKKVVQDPKKLDRRAKKLWNKWYGEKQFHQEPLYPYLLAVVYGVFGHNAYIAFILQALISMCSLWLVVKLTESLFNRQSALVAGALFALFGPAVFYDAILLRASLITFSTLLLLYSAHRLVKNKEKKWPWLLGFAIGLNLLLKFSSIVLVFFIIGFIVFEFRKELKSKLSVFGKVAAMILLTLSPLLIRNMVVGAPLFSFSSVGTITYIGSNGVNYNAYSGFAMDFEDSARIMKASNGKFSKAAGLVVRNFDSFFDFIALQLKKFMSIFHNYEIPNNFNFYHYNLDSIWLTLAGVRFYMVFGLAIMGLGLNWQKTKKTNVLHWSIIAQIIVLTAFYVTSRFKLPLTVCLIPFAAYSLTELWQWIQNKQYTKLAWLIVPISFAAFTLRPIKDIATKIRPTDFTVQYLSEGVPRLNRAADNNDMAEIANIYREYLSKCPKRILNLSSSNPPETNKERETAKFFQGLFQGFADFSSEMGNQLEQQEMQKISQKMLSAINNSK